MRIQNLEISLNLIQKQMKRKNIFVESGMLHSMEQGNIDADSEVKVENLTDIMGAQESFKTSGNALSMKAGQKEILDIQNFFKRPVQIDTISIASGYLEAQVRPWDLYTLNNAVRAKLRNYAYLKGDLHIRIAVAGTPFHYGRLLVSYQPYDKVNETLKNYLVAASFTTDLRQNLFAYLSQAPGAFTIDVKDNKPVHLKCPFISTKPMHRLYNYGTAAIAAGSSYDDLYDAGCLYIYGLTEMNSVAAAYTPIQIYVYAWMENVELGSPTASIVGITTESGRADERETGPIEKIASRAAKVADALSVIPEISPLAVASSMMLRGISNLAAVFGWSKPIIEQRPIFVKNLCYQNGANTIGTDTNLRITLDPKQELSVDPRVCGVETDDMVIGNIARIESYLTYATWASADVPMVDPIWKCCVTPRLFTNSSHSGKVFSQPTALAFTSMPFYFWRGSITFRIDIVCSAFHRGKLLVFYEPNVAQNVLINAAISPNKQFTKVIDIAQTQSVSFTVRWASPWPWLKMNPDPKDVYAYGDNAWSMPDDLGFYNGYIGIVPFNKLLSPDDSSVKINIFVSSDDIQYNFLSDECFPTERKIVTESHMLHPIDVTSCDLNESTASAEDISQLCFGELPVSFRALLKRYAFDYNTQATSASAGTYLKYKKNTIPPTRPLYATAPTSTPCNNLFAYLRLAYLGVKGSVRYRIRILKSITIDANSQWTITNSNPSTYVADAASASTTLSACRVNGTISHTPFSNAGVEFEVPFYSSNLFALSFAQTTLDGSGILSPANMVEEWCRSFEAVLLTDVITNVGIAYEVAAGEDFSFMRFSGAPYHTFTPA
jgi:hypothetical protein